MKYLYTYALKVTVAFIVICFSIPEAHAGERCDCSRSVGTCKGLIDVNYDNSHSTALNTDTQNVSEEKQFTYVSTVSVKVIPNDPKNYLNQCQSIKISDKISAQNFSGTVSNDEILFRNIYSTKARNASEFAIQSCYVCFDSEYNGKERDDQDEEKARENTQDDVVEDGGEKEIKDPWDPTLDELLDIDEDISGDGAHTVGDANFDRDYYPVSEEIGPVTGTPNVNPNFHYGKSGSPGDNSSNSSGNEGQSAGNSGDSGTRTGSGGAGLLVDGTSSANPNIDPFTAFMDNQQRINDGFSPGQYADHYDDVKQNIHSGGYEALRVAREEAEQEQRESLEANNDRLNERREQYPVFPVTTDPGHAGGSHGETAFQQRCSEASRPYEASISRETNAARQQEIAIRGLDACLAVIPRNSQTARDIISMRNTAVTNLNRARQNPGFYSGNNAVNSQRGSSICPNSYERPRSDGHGTECCNHDMSVCVPPIIPSQRN